MVVIRNPLKALSAELQRQQNPNHVALKKIEKIGGDTFWLIDMLTYMAITDTDNYFQIVKLSEFKTGRNLKFSIIMVITM